jgi:hypothetical protein
MEIFNIFGHFILRGHPLIKKKKKKKKNEEIKILPLEMFLATCQAGGHAALRHSPHQA